MKPQFQSGKHEDKLLAKKITEKNKVLVLSRQNWELKKRLNMVTEEKMRLKIRIEEIQNDVEKVVIQVRNINKVL